ncbi:hypothetical protein D3C72_1695180 [compost metagenome]
MLLVGEAHVGQLQPAAPLHVDAGGRVDQDVRHGRVGHQQLDGAEAQHLVLDVADQRAPLDVVERLGLFLQQPPDHGRDFLPQGVGLEGFERRQVEALQQLQVHALLQLLVGVRSERRCGQLEDRPRWPRRPRAGIAVDRIELVPE